MVVNRPVHGVGQAHPCVRLPPLLPKQRLFCYGSTTYASLASYHAPNDTKRGSVHLVAIMTCALCMSIPTSLEFRDDAPEMDHDRGTTTCKVLAARNRPRFRGISSQNTTSTCTLWRLRLQLKHDARAHPQGPSRFGGRSSAYQTLPHTPFTADPTRSGCTNACCTYARLFEIMESGLPWTRVQQDRSRDSFPYLPDCCTSFDPALSSYTAA